MSIQNKSTYNGQNAEEVKLESAKYDAPAFEDIRKDIDSLQSDVANLAANVTKAGSDKAHDAINYVNEHIDSLKSAGINTREKVEGRIKSKPGQSVAIAFAAGLLASFLFGRRS